MADDVSGYVTTGYANARSYTPEFTEAALAAKEAAQAELRACREMYTRELAGAQESRGRAEAERDQLKADKELWETEARRLEKIIYRLEGERDEWKQRAALEARRHLEHWAAWCEILDIARTMLWEFAANTNLGQDKLTSDKRYQRICKALAGGVGRK